MNPLPSPGGRCIPPRGVAPPRHSPAAMPRLYLFGAPCAAGASATRLGPGIHSQTLTPRARAARAGAAANWELPATELPPFRTKERSARDYAPVISRREAQLKREG